MNDEFLLHEECPAELVRAIDVFRRKITSHTTTSKKYSIWSLCKAEVEPALRKVMGDCFYRSLFIKGFAYEAKINSEQLEAKLRLFARSLYKCVHGEEERNKQFSIVESLTFFLYFCNQFRSKKVYARHDPRILESKIHRKIAPDYPFCELCWRLCEFEQIRFNNNNDIKNLIEVENGKKPSFRFCANHRPGTAAYRRDHNRRIEFRNYVKKLGRSLGNESKMKGKEELLELIEDGIDISIQLNKYKPILYSEYYSNIRFAAYRNVHPKADKTKRKTKSIGRTGVTLNIVRLAIANGKNIAQAAEEANVSRQAAWRALKIAGDI